jgi:putative two-component system response regulator
VTDKRVSILIVEDFESDTGLILRQFQQAHYAVSYERVEIADQMRSALERQPWDLIVADYSLPQFDAPSALAVLQKSGLDIPFIVVSGTIGEEMAIALMKAGAHDCIMKHHLPRLVPAMERELSEVQTRRAKRVADEALHQSLKKLRRNLAGTIQAMSSMVEIRDPYTAGHEKNVSVLSRAIAHELGLPTDVLDNVRMAASIHDIGKISVPAEILSKPGRLSDIERSLIQMHSRMGYDILKDVDLPYPIAQIVLQHHERLNGSGYPQGVKIGEILFESRIVSVADVVEAMASHRPYRPALGIDMALEEIEKNKGIFYDAVVVDACVRLFREKGFKLE